MKAEILAGLMFLAIALLVLTSLVVVYSRASEDFEQGMMYNGHHKGGGMHGMTEETHEQCETLRQDHHNATIQRENHHETHRLGCHQ
mgnify:FL=1